MPRNRTLKIKVLWIVCLFIAILMILPTSAPTKPDNSGGVTLGTLQITHQGATAGEERKSVSFLPAVTTYFPAPWSFAVADMNGDNKPDLVAATCCLCCESNNDSGVMVLLGNGDGTFQTGVMHDTGGQEAASVAVANLGFGYGEQDVVVANYCADTSACSGSGESGVSILRGGTGTAATYRSGGSLPKSVRLADVNNDSFPDILVAHTCSLRNASKCSISTPGSIGVLLNYYFDFPLKTYLTGGTETSSLAVADVNGDGQLDLLVTNGCASSTNCANGSVGVLLGEFGLGEFGGTFKKAVTYPVGFFPTDLAAADVNGDGRTDLVVDNGNGAVGVLLGNGDGTFGKIVNYNSGGSNIQSIAVADLNGDGKPDVLVSHPVPSNTVGVLLGNGDGTF